MNWFRCVLAPLVFAIGTTSAVAGDKAAKQKKEKAPKAAPDRAALEKQFSKRMSNSALVGRFTVAGKADEKPPRPERYELESVTKLKGDYWVFLARIKYGKNDVKVPITLKVLWAGDTPVISLTDLTIPGMGTFTARVLFYGDRYVGTWQHGKAGGHMWGRIEKAKAKDDKNEKPKK